ncbi:MAG: hypothetical protein WCE81_08835 [Halobacteriota archaeon]
MNVDTRGPGIRRNLFICKFYDHVGGSPDPIGNFVDKARNWGFNDAEIRDYTKYFVDKGCIKIVGLTKGEMMPTFPELTASGIGYVWGINCKQVEELAKGLNKIDVDVEFE